MFILAQKGDPMPLWFPVLFAGMWLTVGYWVSRQGWKAFADRHGGGLRPAGPAYASPYTKFSSHRATYRNAVRVVPAAEGLWFYVMFLFRAFHPPFLLPWSSVKRVEELSWFHMHGYRLHIEDEAGSVTVNVRHTFREVLERHRPDLLAGLADDPERKKTHVFGLDQPADKRDRTNLECTKSKP